MIQVKIPHVVEYEDRLKYRRTVPPDVREVIGRKNWTRTWKPDTPLAQIEAEAAQLARLHDAEIRVARGEAEAEEIARAEADARAVLKQQRFEDLAFIAENPTPTDAYFLAAVESGGVVRRSIPLSQAVARHAVGRDQKPFKFALQSFEAVHGDPDILAIRRSDVATWIDHEHRRGVKPSTVRRRLDALRASVERAYLDADVIQRNPFAKHTIMGGQGSRSDRVPLHKTHLALLDDYLKTSKRLRPDTRNLINLLRWTGAGTAEVAGLETRDVILDHEISHVWIRPNGVRTLKTDARERQVSLLPEALEAARDAVERAGDRAELFEGYDRGGRKAEYFSSRLNQILRRAGVPRNPRLTIYSLRHCWVEALHAAGIRERLIRYIVGHSGRDIHGKYGADKALLAEVLAALEKAAPLLGEVDPAVYRAGELA